jgi:peptidoglycan glycosyltransferase
MKKPNIKLNIRVTLAVFVLLFLILGGYLAYSVGKYGSTWFSMPYNPRIAAARESVEAGTVYDRNGVALAWTEGGVRRYAADGDTRRAVAHVVGDTQGKTIGAQTYYAKYLYGYDKSVFERLNLAASGDDLSGSDIKLTIDSDLCTYIYNHMDYNGAVVVLDTETGEVLASVSKPSFDPEDLPYITEEDEEGSEYVNRATMGKYPPGSTMKIVTAAAALENGVDFTYDCTGSQIIEGQDITCPEDGGHGSVDLESAFIESCNTYFGLLSTKLGGNTLAQTAKNFLYNTEFNFSDFLLYSSQFESSDNLGDVAWAGIGQYNDLITPMHNAMIAGAIANNGKMLEPKLLLDVLHDGDSVYDYSANTLTTVTRADTAQTIKEFMRETVEEGTATSAQVGGVTVCGKTGTAEYVSDDGEIKNHSWFVGFVDGSAHPLAISVVLEGAGYGSAHAAPLAGDVLAYAIDLGY